MKSRICISLLLIWIATAGPAAAFTELSAHIEPIQPLAGEDFVIVIEGMTETMPVTVEGVVRGEQDLEIRLQRPSCLNPTCQAQTFRIEVPIDGASSPFAEDLVGLWINGREGGGIDRDTLIRTHFAVGYRFYHSTEPEIVLNPQTPTDNDRIQLLVPVQANVCGPEPPWLDRIVRDGSQISVFLRFGSRFGREFSTRLGLDPKCSPPQPYLGVTPVDLGTLEAGSYTLDLYFDDPPGFLPMRVRTRGFVVPDEPDTVELRDGRFTVGVEWMDADGNSGVGKPVPGPTSDSTLFTFFGPNNWEILIKVLDGCALNDRFWVFGAAATDAQYTITVTDTDTSAVWTYTNPLGTASDAINDTNAFATCP